MTLSNSKNKQKGVVIIVALFVMAFVAGIAYVMIGRLARDIHVSMLLIRQQQAEYYAVGSIAWAKDKLQNNWIKQKRNRLIDLTPIEAPVINVDGYQIRTTIYDLQSRFNINSISKTGYQRSFEHLLQILFPNMSQSKRASFILALQEWINPNAPDTELSRYYLSLSKPYRSAHRLLISVSEMNLIKGMTAEMYQKLKNHIVALPKVTKINLQTAPEIILMTLSPDMTLLAAKKIVKLREQTPITSIPDFFNKNKKWLDHYHITSEMLTNVSDYFLVETHVKIENQHLVLYTLLNRSINRGIDVTVKQLWQSKGNW